MDINIKLCTHIFGENKPVLNIFISKSLFENYEFNFGSFRTYTKSFFSEAFSFPRKPSLKTSLKENFDF